MLIPTMLCLAFHATVPATQSNAPDSAQEERASVPNQAQPIVERFHDRVAVAEANLFAAFEREVARADRLKKIEQRLARKAELEHLREAFAQEGFLPSEKRLESGALKFRDEFEQAAEACSKALLKVAESL